MLFSRYGLGVVVGSLLGACGPSGSGSDPGGEASGGTASGGTASGGAASGGTASGGSGTTGGASTSGGAGNSGGSGGSAAGAGGSGGGEPPTKWGQVMLIQDQTPTLSAQFMNESTSSGSTCVRVTSGACGARTCDEAPAGQAELTYPHAGTVTLTSPDVAGLATATPGSNGLYKSTGSFEGSFNGGESALFEASGGDVPAFQQELTMPLVLLLSQPAYQAGATPMIARSSDLTLQWSRGTAGVIFYVQGSSARLDGLPGSAFLSCAFPSEEGSGVVPSSMLQTLAAGTTLLFLTITTTIVTAGEYQVTAAMTHGVYNEAKDLRIKPKLE